MRETWKRPLETNFEQFGNVDPEMALNYALEARRQWHTYPNSDIYNKYIVFRQMDVNFDVVAGCSTNTVFS